MLERLSTPLISSVTVLLPAAVNLIVSLSTISPVTDALKERLSPTFKPLIPALILFVTSKANVSESFSPEIIEMPVLFAMLKISFSVSVSLVLGSLP